MFPELQLRISRIIRRFPRDPLSLELSEANADKVSSAIMLINAEIEEFLENSVSRLLSASYDCWMHDKRVTITLLACLHHKHKAGDVTNQNSVKHELGKPIMQAVCLAYKCGMQAITDSHGTGEDKLNNLLKMVGCDLSEIQTEISVIDNFTRQRGKISHLSSKSHGVVNVHSPSVIKSNVASVMNAVKKIDQVLNGLFSLCCTEDELTEIRKKANDAGAAVSVVDDEPAE